MTRTRLSGFGLILIFFSLSAAAADRVTVLEGRIRLEVNEAATLLVPVINPTNQPMQTNASMAFVTRRNATAYATDLTVAIGPGSSTLRIPVPGFSKLKEAANTNYDWLRLQYVIDDVKGIVSISRIAPEPFVLDVVRSSRYGSTSNYRVQVFARNPATAQPVANVEVEAKVSTDDDNPSRISRNAHTNSNGYADFAFELSQFSPGTDLDVEVTGKLRGFVRTLSDSVSFRPHARFVMTTDKPLYQPGQKLRVRALLFDQTNKAIKGKRSELIIHDPDNEVVFQVPVESSAYGELHAEWEIPETARAGAYSIRLENDDAYFGQQSVWIGRYDLPNFSVDVHHDQPFYRSGQNAKIDVQANYLFGKPVPFSTVRVVRELERHWNYREQKWDTQEGPTVTGMADEKGLFSTTLSLDDDTAKLQDGYPGYKDITYGVYATDPSTGRTEQHRLSLRIARNPIQLYVAQPFQPLGLAYEFYVFASYADGTPATCDVRIFERRADSRPLLTSVRTNKYGVAKISGLKIAPNLQDRWNRSPQLELQALDSARNTGLSTQYLSEEENVLQIHTDKVLYRDGDPLVVRIESASTMNQAFLMVAKGPENLYTTGVRLTNGTATVRIPPSKSFTGPIAIIATHAVETAYAPHSQRNVLFPDKSDIQIDAIALKDSYRPNEEATLNLRVRNADGTPQQALLGFSVFDKAVAERARTDFEFGGGFTCWGCNDPFIPDTGLPGLSWSDIRALDPGKTLAPDLELAVEAILANAYRAYQPEMLIDETDASFAFASGDLQAILNRLRASGRDYPSGFELPKEQSQMHSIITALDADFEMRRDPWDVPYHLKSERRFQLNFINVVSSGPDKVVDTPDDFNVASASWPYFAEYGGRINNALATYHERTSGYVRDLATLKSELLRNGHNFEDWHDPDGKPFLADFDIHETRYTVTIRTQDRAIVWTGGTDYTIELSIRINNSLQRSSDQHNAVPESDQQLREALAAANIPATDLVDVWGTPYYAVFKLESGYFDSVTLISANIDVKRFTPVTRHSRVIRLRSAGPDRKEGTPDDFTVLLFVRPLDEETTERALTTFMAAPVLDANHGAILGEVIDQSGALIPGVTITIESASGAVTTLTTSGSGDFQARGLPPGVYQAHCSLPGFHTKHLTNVVVASGNITRLLITLEIGTVSSAVDVSVAADQRLQTSSASVGTASQANTKTSPAQLATPRLRDFFPETLLWQPAVETTTDGKARVKFKLADSITTWKATMIASTKDGRVAFAEKEITAFQPFFIEHDPPKFLTKGDEIALPVVVRNYLDRSQAIDLSMAPEPWFKTLDTSSRKIEVRANESQRETFFFEAAALVHNGPQRITARGTGASDAIEKTSTVLPFGRELTEVSGGVFRSSTTFNPTIPASTIEGSISGELKIYPNLMAHVTDAIEEIMRRPHGCAEQVTSSAYPSLLYLEYIKRTRAPQDATSRKALRYLRTAVDVLRGYQSESGGFPYWSNTRPDIAVSAYALQFLVRATEFTAVDSSTMERSRKWLLDQQKINGSWGDERELTAYVAAVLSRDGILQNGGERVLASLRFLEKGRLQPEVPYVTAAIAIAASSVGDKAMRDTAIADLKSNLHREGEAVYWDLQSNTPFYGWGLPGRLETTALAVQALAMIEPQSEFVDKGLLFLLKNKDALGVWYSTQATARVLEALTQLAGNGRRESSGSADIVINGTRVGNMELKADLNNPVRVDVSKFLVKGANRLELVERKKSSAATAHLVTRYYVPWTPASQQPTQPLRLSVKYDNHNLKINDVVTVHVQAERVGFRGYGMMLAEIGLPPGAEVDRASLNAALKSADYSIPMYDVLPDRVVVYLWPTAGGTTFDFQFRPRFGMTAHTTPSTLYDYYNPDAATYAEPQQFVVN